MATPAGGEGAAVHFWLERVGGTAEPRDLAILDDEERARAHRFSFERDRRRFVARRAFLRRVLAEYTGGAPARIRYRKSPTGKPQLADVDGVAFSTSHADGLAIVAVATGGEVGVDIERIRAMPDALDIARRFFTEHEAAHLSAIAGPMRSAAFLRLWTRKEAYVKALGHGLALPLDDFEVLEPVVPPSARLWSVDVPDEYVASVAVTAVTVAPMQRALMRMAS
jgi:4'-phosphopantetheinyl transferase